MITYLFSLLLQFLISIPTVRAAPPCIRARQYYPPTPALNTPLKYGRSDGSREVVRPKVMIVSMFAMEAEAWTRGMPELLKLNITVPGLAAQFPTVHCTAADGVCQMVTGVGEINAAASLFAISHSPLFDVRKTYFVIAGIAGGNPERTTLGSVTFPRYAVQVDLQYELDGRDVPRNWSSSASGYFPLGTTQPGVYPGSIYGTEVFELSTTLRSLAVRGAKRAKLSDTDEAQIYRAKYRNKGYAPYSYAAAVKPPCVVECDTATSNTYWAGAKLAKTYESYSRIFTNGSAVYCSTQQEDNGSLTSLVRAASSGMVDFKRVIIMRSISDFDRAPPGAGVSEYENLTRMQMGFEIAVENLFSVGREVVGDIVRGWKGLYERGVGARNYAGDVINTLRQAGPDIGHVGFYVI